MGCWNATCGLTGLPITDNDPVIAMVIQEERLRDGNPCYPWEMWSPASVIVRGLYDDYGGVHLTDAERHTLALSRDDSKMVMDKIPLADGGHGYGFVKTSGFVIDAEENEDEYSLSRQPKGFTLWMAHAGIFDDLCKNIEITDYSDGEFKDKSIEEITRATIAANKEANVRFGNPWNDRGSEFRGAAIRYLSSMIYECREDGDNAGYENSIMLWGELHSLNRIMMVLRRTLYPTGAAGSQDTSFEAHRALYRAAEGQIKRTEEKWV